MPPEIPLDTIKAFARTIFAESHRYGFRQLDIVRLINELMDLSTGIEATQVAPASAPVIDFGVMYVASFPLRSKRLEIRRADPVGDFSLISTWIGDAYGKHFLLSSATAQRTDLKGLLRNSANEVGIVFQDDRPIGAVAFLDIDKNQRRAELRKLIGDKSARGKGLAEEATRLWIEYGGQRLNLQKIYVSTLQTHIRNIQLNESIGFRVEGVLSKEVLIDGERYDVLRMGFCYEQ
ncbi:MAG: GNAT family N-acetyltransferase [Gammaproteobacteria bacterium]|nr:GNAT family N-acetyltransferase [Gammaproteobacteria bacterium]MDH4254907.1 GNAT family N-acetyltransferase [Gammaproteobacteria bacterium]MDH5309908.1 GNAT family N-acetyltransferase [Gammaproteobacteria bacterium]